MKLKIANGTEISGELIEVDGPVVKLFGKSKAKGGIGSRRPLLVAYHLHPGETVRANFNGTEEVYEINQ